MKKSFFLVLAVAALFTACNNSEKQEPAAAEPAKETQVNVVVEQPKQETPAQKVEIDDKGVKINVTDPNGNKIEINAKDPK